MTISDKDLDEIEERLKATRSDMGLQALSSYTGASGALPISDVTALIAEVRRLRKIEAAAKVLIDRRGDVEDEELAMLWGDFEAALTEEGEAR